MILATLIIRVVFIIFLLSVNIEWIIKRVVAKNAASIDFSEKTKKMFNLGIILDIGVRIKSNRGLLFKELIDNYLKEKIENE